MRRLPNDTARDLAIHRLVGLALCIPEDYGHPDDAFGGNEGAGILADHGFGYRFGDEVGSGIGCGDGYGFEEDGEGFGDGIDYGDGSGSGYSEREM